MKENLKTNDITDIKIYRTEESDMYREIRKKLKERIDNMPKYKDRHLHMSKTNE